MVNISLPDETDDRGVHCVGAWPVGNWREGGCAAESFNATQLFLRSREIVATVHETIENQQLTLPLLSFYRNKSPVTNPMTKMFN